MRCRMKGCDRCLVCERLGVIVFVLLFRVEHVFAVVVACGLEVAL